VQPRGPGKSSPNRKLTKIPAALIQQQKKVTGAVKKKPKSKAKAAAGLHWTENERKKCRRQNTRPY